MILALRVWGWILLVARWILGEPVGCLEFAAVFLVAAGGKTGNYATTVMCGFDANWGCFSDALTFLLRAYADCRVIHDP